MDTNSLSEDTDKKIDFLYTEIRVLHKKIDMMADTVAREAANLDIVSMRLHKFMNPDEDKKKEKPKDKPVGIE